MSNTKIHKQKALFNSGLITFKSTSKQFKLQCYRHNADIGYYRNLRNNKKELYFIKFNYKLN
ncbi:MAG TPA: hypothetical protein VIK86_01265 [Candidatus Paceibacterota bacterium]